MTLPMISETEAVETEEYLIEIDHLYEIPSRHIKKIRGKGLLTGVE